MNLTSNSLTSNSSAAPALVQLLGFQVGEENYVVDILRVREIVSRATLLPVRNGPPYIDHVVTIRGQVVPVMNLRRRLGLPDAPMRTLVIITVDQHTVGLLVDRVLGALKVLRSAIYRPASLLNQSQIAYFLGVCHDARASYFLLNVRTLLTTAQPVKPPEL